MASYSENTIILNYFSMYEGTSSKTINSLESSITMKSEIMLFSVGFWIFFIEELDSEVEKTRILLSARLHYRIDCFGA